MGLIIKGFIVGIGKILPGVSGSMLAITLGIYEETIKIISQIKTITKEKAIYLTKIALGIILSITLTSKIIVKCLKNYYLPTILLFIGIIIGGIIKMIKQTKPQKKEIIISIFIILIIIIILQKSSIMIITEHKLKYTISDFLKLIIIGIIDAISSIIPGISGTAILMTIGYYNIIINMFSSITDIHNLKQNLFILIPFAIGFIIGIIEIAKLLNKIIEKKKNTINTITIIFMMITIIILIKKTIEINTSLTQKIIGIILLIIGIIINTDK